MNRQIAEHLKRYKDGMIGFAELMAHPQWRTMIRHIRSKMRGPAWYLDDDDILQEAAIIVHRAIAQHVEHRSRMAQLVAERALASWPAPPELDDAALAEADNMRVLPFERFVMNQFWFWTEVRVRDMLKIKHRAGARPAFDVLVGGRRDDAFEDVFERFVNRFGGVAASQDEEVGRRISTERLPGEVRGAVAELFESGSVDRALSKLADYERPRSVLGEAVRQVVGASL